MLVGLLRQGRTREAPRRHAGVGGVRTAATNCNHHTKLARVEGLVSWPLSFAHRGERGSQRRAVVERAPETAKDSQRCIRRVRLPPCKRRAWRPRTSLPACGVACTVGSRHAHGRRRAWASCQAARSCAASMRTTPRLRVLWQVLEKLAAMALTIAAVSAGMCNDKRPDCSNWARDSECTGDNSVRLPQRDRTEARCATLNAPRQPPRAAAARRHAALSRGSPVLGSCRASRSLWPSSAR